jgi:hypothetical protein
MGEKKKKNKEGTKDEKKKRRKKRKEREKKTWRDVKSIHRVMGNTSTPVRFFVSFFCVSFFSGRLAPLNQPTATTPISIAV